MDRPACCNFHGTEQCYRQMLHVAVILCGNFLQLVTSSQTALVMRRSLRQYFITAVPYFPICTLYTCVRRHIFYSTIRKLKYKMLFSEISKQNNDYSDTICVGRGRGEGRGGHIFHSGGPEYKFAMLICTVYCM